MVDSGLIKGPQEQCPEGAWTVDTNGRETKNWECCSNCIGGTRHCYSDCGWYHFSYFYHSWILICKYLLIGLFTRLHFYFIVNAVQPTRAWSYPSGVVWKNTTVYGTDHRAMKNLVVNYSNIVKLLISVYTFTYISSP